ncbi:MAG: PIG-L family deacetylase [Chloroflexi bacterium]|nr:PIG-L family deacetylase [Chloroflexota bacterium]
MSEHPTLLAVFAHPDDESIRCGGTLALLAKKGWRIHVLTATTGQAGSCGDPPLCAQEELGAVRAAELQCACEALGLEPPQLLEYRDGTLSQVDEDAAAAQVFDTILQCQPQVLLSWPPDGLSGHPDHIAVSRWSELAFQRAVAAGMAVPVALYHLVVPQSMADALGSYRFRPVPDEAVSLAVDVMPVWDKKLKAIHCHRTQLGSSPILAAPPDHQRVFLGLEHFRQAASLEGKDPLDALPNVRRYNASCNN